MTTFTHEVNVTILSVCNATIATQAMNFTVYNATNPYPKISKKVFLFILLFLKLTLFKHEYSDLILKKEI